MRFSVAGWCVVCLLLVLSFERDVWDGKRNWGALAQSEYEIVEDDWMLEFDTEEDEIVLLHDEVEKEVEEEMGERGEGKEVVGEVVEDGGGNDGEEDKGGGEESVDVEEGVVVEELEEGEEEQGGEEFGKPSGTPHVGEVEEAQSVVIDDGGDIVVEPVLERDFRKRWIHTELIEFASKDPFATPRAFQTLEDQLDMFHIVEGTISLDATHGCAIVMVETGKEEKEQNRYCQCWGADVYDLGKLTPPHPTEYVEVSVGGEFTCGRTDDDLVECWGVKIVNPPPEVHFRHITSGGFFACGVVRGDDERIEGGGPGPIRCWGRSEKGQRRPPSGDFVSVSAGEDFACGLRPTGLMTCWGHFPKGKIPNLPFTQLAASPSQRAVCGLQVNGSVTCFGDGIAHGRAARTWDGPFIQIAHGGRIACGLLNTLHLRCFIGSNPIVKAIPQDAQFLEISAGGGQVCAVDANPPHQIHCFGPPHPTRGAQDTIPFPKTPIHAWVGQ